jgi:hypothetical protein
VNTEGSVRTIADDSPDNVRPVHLLNPFLGMLAMPLTGTAAWMNENYVLLVSCASVFLAAMTLEVVWLVLLYRRRRHRSARPYGES